MKQRKRMTALCAAVALTAGMAGCQPTPEKEAVVQKNTGAFENAVAVSTAGPYEAPARYESELTGADGVSIRFVADVELPALEKYPVYSARPVALTQEQVDNVLNVLLDGETLYENNTEQRSRDEIQRDIDYYTRELEACGDDPQFADSAATYRQWLKEFMIEYENAPETLDLKLAERTLQFNENDPEVLIYYAEAQSGGVEEEVSPVLSEEGKQRAKADGNECVTGVFWKDFGGKSTKMQFYASNKGTGLFGRAESKLYYRPFAGEVETPSTDLTPEEAERQATELIKQMKIDAELVDVSRAANFEWIDNEDGTVDTIDKGTAHYEITFRHRVPDTVHKNVSAAHWMIEQDASYIYPVPNERITVRIGENGVTGFSWGEPMEVVTLENENTPLLPFEQIAQRAEAQLKSLSAGVSFLSGGDSDSQRIEVDRFTLSYLMTRKENATDEYHFIPVWDVCGNVFYHYPDDYPDSTSNHFVLDENRERAEYVIDEQNDNTPISLVTINAIDGSVIERPQGG